MLSVVNHELESDERTKKRGKSECLCETSVRDQTYPTKLGRIVQLLALVRMGVLFLSASAKLGKATKKGPARRRCRAEVRVNTATSFAVRRSALHLPFHAERDRATTDGNMVQRRVLRDDGDTRCGRKSAKRQMSVGTKWEPSAEFRFGSRKIADRRRNRRSWPRALGWSEEFVCVRISVRPRFLVSHDPDERRAHVLPPAPGKRRRSVDRRLAKTGIETGRLRSRTAAAPVSPHVDVECELAVTAGWPVIQQIEFCVSACQREWAARGRFMRRPPRQPHAGISLAATEAAR